MLSPNPFCPTTGVTLSFKAGEEGKSFFIITTRSQSSSCPRTCPVLASQLHPLGDGFANSTHSIGSVFSLFSSKTSFRKYRQSHKFSSDFPGGFALRRDVMHVDQAFLLLVFFTTRKVGFFPNTLSHQTCWHKGQGKSN